MGKSADAFRTISEVADWLDTPAHVLRFWESKFSQVKPVKRAGGRRYYRPADMRLLGGIKKLLHSDGMTIKSAQKLLRESGVKHVAALSQPLDNDETDTIITAVATEIKSTPLDPAADTALAAPQDSISSPLNKAGETPPALPDAAFAADDDEAEAISEASSSIPEADLPPVMPSFSHRQVAKPQEPEAAPVTPETVPVNVDVPDDPPDDISGEAGVLSRIAALSYPLPRQTAVRLAPIMIRLREIATEPGAANKD